MVLFFHKQLTQINFGVKAILRVKDGEYISENVLETFFPYLQSQYETY